MVFMLHKAHTFDPPFSSMAVFNDVNNSKTRYSATLASFPGECVGEANCDPVSCWFNVLLKVLASAALSVLAELT